MSEVLDLYHYYGQLCLFYTGSCLYVSTTDLSLDLGV
jgi:hypothetical protein